MQPRQIARRGLCPSSLFRLASVLLAGFPPERARLPRATSLLLTLGLTLGLASRSQANLQIDRSQLDFGSQDLCTSASLQIKVTLDGADAPVANSTDESITGLDAGDFVVVYPVFSSQSNLSDAVTNTYTIKFTPTAAGARTATLKITFSGESPLSIPLSGTGTGAMPPVSLPCPLPTLMFNADSGACQASGLDPAGPKAAGACDAISVTGMRSDGLPLTDPYPVGTTTITWNAIDTNGSQAMCTQPVTVADNQPPSITAPPDVTAATDPGQCTASHVSLGSPARGDNCGVMSVTNDAPPAFSPGTTTVTWTITDTSGNQRTATQKVHVNDTQAPAITGVSATPTQLWPPNHQWVPVTINYAASDNCGATTCRLSVSNNESGTADAVVVDAQHVQLLATRAGSGSGRIYTITITGTDASGNTTPRTVTVTVPHN